MDPAPWRSRASNLVPGRRRSTVMRRSIWLAALFMLLVPCVAYANPELLALQNDDGQWAMQGKNYSAQRYSTLSQITADNVKNLKTAWTFSLGTLQGQEGGPLVV